MSLDKFDKSRAGESLYVFAVLQHALIKEDQKGITRQAKNPRAYHNPYYLVHVMNAAANVKVLLDNGTPLRSALTNCFNGSLLNKLLKLVGEEKATDQEQRF